jgi:hypothetical protein
VQATILAGGPAPGVIEKRLQFVKHQVVGGDDAKLEVAAFFVLCPKSGPRKIRATHVGTFSVDDDGFQMNTRTHAHLESACDSAGWVGKTCASFEISRERTRRWRCVQESYFDASGDEPLKQHEHGIEIVLSAVFASDAGQDAGDGTHQLFEIGGGDPDAGRRVRNGTDNGVGVTTAGHKPNWYVARLSDEISR